MDQAWGIIFIGTKSGHVSRFHIKVCMTDAFFNFNLINVDIYCIVI